MLLGLQQPLQGGHPLLARRELRRLAQELDPACVSACPTRCMYFGILDDPESRVSRLLRSRTHKTLLPETGNLPNVYYLV